MICSVGFKVKYYATELHEPTHESFAAEDESNKSGHVCLLLCHLTTASHKGSLQQASAHLWVLYSVWWHIPKPKAILFCCHETFPWQKTNRESETTCTDLNQNLNAGGIFQEVQIVNNTSWHLLSPPTNLTSTCGLMHLLYWRNKMKWRSLVTNCLI